MTFDFVGPEGSGDCKHAAFNGFTILQLMGEKDEYGWTVVEARAHALLHPRSRTRVFTGRRDVGEEIPATDCASAGGYQ